MFLQTFFSTWFLLIFKLIIIFIIFKKSSHFNGRLLVACNLIPLKTFYLIVLQESKNKIMRQLYVKLILPKKDHFHASAMEGFLRLCQEDKYALVTSDMSMLRFEGEDIPCNIQKVPQTNIPGSVSIAIKKKSPYRNLFNYQ